MHVEACVDKGSRVCDAIACSSQALAVTVAVASILHAGVLPVLDFWRQGCRTTSS